MQRARGRGACRRGAAYPSEEEGPAADEEGHYGAARSTGGRVLLAAYRRRAAGPSTWPEYKQAHASGETNAELLVLCRRRRRVEGSLRSAQFDGLCGGAGRPGPQATGSAAGAAHARRALCKRAGTGAGAFQRVRGLGRRPGLDRGGGAGASARAGARVCRGPLRSVRSDGQHAGARRGLGARAPGAGRGPVRPRCPVPSTPSRRVDGVWYTFNTDEHTLTRSLRRAPATKLKFKKRRPARATANRGAPSRSTCAPSSAACKCGKLKADHIGPDLKCPPC